eukprot:1050744-Rhodomonas_salina.1
MMSGRAMDCVPTCIGRVRSRAAALHPPLSLSCVQPLPPWHNTHTLTRASWSCRRSSSYCQ